MSKNQGRDTRDHRTTSDDSPWSQAYPGVQDVVPLATVVLPISMVVPGMHSSTLSDSRIEHTRHRIDWFPALRHIRVIHTDNHKTTVVWISDSTHNGIQTLAAALASREECKK